MKAFRWASSRLGLLLIATAVWAGSSYPTPQGRVSDYVGVIDASTKAQLEQIIQDVDRTTGAEIAVVCIPTFNGETVEGYANGLFKAWGIGKKGRDNGVLVLVAIKDRQMRIEVGYGLEAILPDGIAGYIIREDFQPAFKRQDYGAGLHRGVSHIAAYLKSSSSLPSPGGHPVHKVPRWIGWVLLSVFLLGCGGVCPYIAGRFLKSKILFGVIVPLLPTLWVMTLCWHNPLARWLSILGAIVGIVWGYLRGQPLPGEGGSKGWSAFPSRSGSGRSSGGFGGGSSGGGGASGRW